MIAYGIIDEETGNIYATYSTEDEARGLDYVPLTENYTWLPSDYTDRDGQNWISVERLIEEFGRLVKSTGMKKSELAKRCGITPGHFSRYCTGKVNVPPLVWKEVERIAKQNAE